MSKSANRLCQNRPKNQYGRIASMPKLTRKLPTKYFILFNLSLFLLSLIFLLGLYYTLNLQYQSPSQAYSDSGLPLTSEPKSLIIDLEQPEDNLLTFDSSIVVSGKTTPNMDVLISTESKDVVIKASSSGSFSTVLSLDEGINTISAVVFDILGEERKEVRSVYFSKEKI